MKNIQITNIRLCFPVRKTLLAFLFSISESAIEKIKIEQLYVYCYGLTIPLYLVDLSSTSCWIYITDTLAHTWRLTIPCVFPMLLSRAVVFRVKSVPGAALPAYPFAIPMFWPAEGGMIKKRKREHRRRGVLSKLVIVC